MVVVVLLVCVCVCVCVCEGVRVGQLVLPSCFLSVLVSQAVGRLHVSLCPLTPVNDT